jgi:ankyrin repeat protein
MRYLAPLLLLLTACGNLGPPLSPIIVAARLGDAEKIQELAAAGADVNDRGGVNNWTALMHAIHKNQPAAVRALLAAGADPNATTGRESALSMAAAYGYADIVRLLLDKNAKVDENALSAAAGGSTDIDRFTAGHCQADALRAILEKDPSLRASQNTIRIAKLAGCRDLAALLKQ